jgi:hypothetical protein
MNTYTTFDTTEYFVKSSFAVGALTLGFDFLVGLFSNSKELTADELFSVTI